MWNMLETFMPKFLFTASYTSDGAKGLIKEGGSARKAHITKLIKSMGGKLESYYYAFGDADVYLIADLPDAATAAALSLTVNMAGVVHLKTIPLLAAEEIDEAAMKSV